MTPNTERLVSFWRDQAETFIDQLVDDQILRGVARNLGRQPDRDNLHKLFGAYVRSWIASLEANTSAPLFEVIHEVSPNYSGIDVSDMMRMVDINREHIWRLMAQLYAAGDWDMDVVELVERWLHEERKADLKAYEQLHQEIQARLARSEQALEDQGRLLQELSAPIVPIHEGILVLPLVGAVDSRRASQIMESALEQIVAYQADVLILDITGVPVVDTGVANYILQMARAVTLLGSKVVLVGIGAEIAQTIVQLGVELRDMTTLANLQAGIAYALAMQGFAIQPTSLSKRDV